MRSDNETPMLRRFWNGRGTLIREFTLVERNETREGRYIDGLILPHIKSLKLPEGTSNEWDYRKLSKRSREIVQATLAGAEIWAVQVKASQLGFSLMGQAFFSKLLLLAFKPRSIRVFAVCGQKHALLGELMKRSGIEVVVDSAPMANGGMPTGSEREGIRLSRERIRKYWRNAVSKGTLVFNYPLTDKHRAHAIILLDGEFRESDADNYSPEALKGRRVLVLTTRGETNLRPGMSSLGRAYYTSLLAKRLGAEIVGSLILCENEDSALRDLLRLKRFAYLKFCPEGD